MSHTEEQLKAFAAQARNPTGPTGEDLGEQMHDANSEIYDALLSTLQVSPNDLVVELGPGSGLHVPALLAQHPESRYLGLDISGTMVNYANTHVQHKNASFKELAIENGFAKLPVESGKADLIFTANTIYFWDAALEQAKELYRILKPSGHLYVAFIDSEDFKQYPFTKYNYTLYTTDAATKLLEQAGFQFVDLKTSSDNVIPIHDKDAAHFNRAFHILVVKK